MPHFTDTLFLLAQTTSGTDSGGGPGNLFLFIGIVIFALYFIVLRPQKKEQDKRQNLLNELKKGDKVVTTGGIHATVASAGDGDTVQVEIAKNTKITLNRSSISVVKGKDEPKDTSDKKSESNTKKK